ncbi:MAG TPA: DUF5596 domain-containing protein [Firmicutes bacterium]|nr:DUF5596 domain-containing protein [Bacillota bacterium]
MPGPLTLSQVLEELHITDSAALWQPYWEESMAGLAACPRPLPSREQILEDSRWCGLSAAAGEELAAFAGRVENNPALLQLYWHCCCLLYDHEDYGKTGEWPYLTQVLGDEAGLFYLLVGLAMVPRVKEVHRKMGVPAEVSRETCLQIACFAGNYYRATGGKYGISLKQIYWLRHYTAGQLFRLGRFEYRIKPFQLPVEVYRHMKTGCTLALAAAGWLFNGEGYIVGKEPNSELPGSWLSEMEYGERTVSGYPVSPFGMALRRKVELNLDEWQCVLRRGDKTLDMHIPAGGGMTPEVCRASFEQAPPFFARFFPEEKVNAITSSSWIFNNQLQEITLSSDNLAAFQREIYLFPVLSSGRDGLWFIFLQDEFDPATAPRQTSLQRAVADYIQAGNRWRGGGMFFLIPDLVEFGRQVYRRRWPECLRLAGAAE